MESTKIRYAMIVWKLKEGKEVLCNINDDPGRLKLRSEKHTCTQVELRRNDMATAESQLGVMLAMGGNDKEEYNFKIL